MTLTPNRNYRVLTNMDSEVDVDYDLLDFQAHQASDKARKPQNKKAKRGRPAGSTKDGQAIAKQQKEHRELVLRALPDLGFDIRRQAAIYRDRSTLQPKVLNASSIKNIHHKIGEILSESLRQDHARSAVEYLLAANQRDPVVTYLESCRGRAIEMSWEAIVKRIFKTDDDLAARIFQKWMVGAAKRPLEPGCVMDWLMILVGAQGIGKPAVGRALIPSSEALTGMASSVQTLTCW